MVINQFSSDQELWDAIKNGNEKAFNFLFDRYWECVYTTVFTITSDKEICMEMVHDIFLNVWLKRDQLNISRFKAYLTAAARYHVYRYIKTLRKTPVTYTENYELALHQASSARSDENIVYEQLEEQIENHLTMLPKRCKEIFVLSRKQQLSNDEIAKHLDISKRTVENQLTSALHHLRVALKSILTIFIIITFR